jgi:hypothetical protein
MKSQAITWIFTAFLGIVFFGCKGTKPAKTIGKGNFEKIQNISDFKYLTFKSKLHFDDAKSKLNFKSPVDINLQRDSAVWISARPAMGIEAMRILVRKDSVFALDRINKVFYAYSYEDLSKKVSFPLSYDLLQELLLGNLPDFGAEWRESETEKSEDAFHLNMQTQDIFCQAAVTRNAGRPKKINATDKNKNLMLMEFENFEQSGKFVLAKLMKAFMFTQENGANPALQIEIEHNRIEFPAEKPAFHFAVPASFERK